MHAAIIAREVRRGIPGARVPDIKVFLLRDPTERQVEANEQVSHVLSTVATKISAKESSKRLRDARKRRASKKPAKVRSRK